MKAKKLILAAVIFFSGSAIAHLALAHAVVSPKQAGVGAFQSFSLGVPVEQDTPTIAVRLVIPDGLQYVTPTVKPGWKIDVKKEGEGESAKVTEISWTGGSIPPGQRDDFGFSAKVPAQETKLQWKAYQTYAGGTVVSWDQDPGGENPYSVTAVVNDLSGAASSSTDKAKKNLNWPIMLSIAALALSVVALSKSAKRTQ